MTIASVETANNPTAAAAAAQKGRSSGQTAEFGFDFADMLSRVRIDSEAQLSILKTDRTSQPLADPAPRSEEPAASPSDHEDNATRNEESSAADGKRNASENNSGQQQANTQQKTVATPLYAINAAQTAQADTAGQTQAVTQNATQTAQQNAAPEAAARITQPGQTAAVQTTPEAAAQAAAAQTRGKGEQKAANSNAGHQGDVVKAPTTNAQQQAQDLSSRLQPGEKVQVNVKNDAAVNSGPATPLSGDTATEAKLLPTDMRGMAGQVKPEGQNGQNGQNGQAQATTQNAAANQPPAGSQPKGFDAALASQLSRFEAPQPAAASNSTTPTTSNPLGRVEGMPAPSGAPTGTGNLNQTANTAAAQSANAKRATPQAQQVMQQVSVQVSKAVAQGLDRIQMQLKPADLGRVDIQLEVTHDGRVNAVVQVEKQETLDMMRQDSRQLEQALKDAGLKTDGGSLQFSLRGEGGQDGAGQKTASNGGPGSGEGDGGDGTDQNEAGHPEHQDIVSDDQINVVV
ncbi:MAG: flagellar hook-length control protein FliK [Rhodospirillales bacterium]